MDSHYAPSISWWAIAARSSQLCIEKYSFYRKGTYRNRCHIYGANGLLRLSVPLYKGKHQRSTIERVRISNDHPWQKLHWESLCSAYRSSPYFEFYEQEFEDLYLKQTKNLFDFNQSVIDLIASLIGLSISIQFSKEYMDSYDKEWTDLREKIHPNAHKQLHFINAEFEKYIQVFSSKLGYLPNLSIFDLLFNLGPASLDYLQNKVKINVS